MCTLKTPIHVNKIPEHFVMLWAEHVSGAETRLERSGAVSGVQKIKWSGAGAGGRGNGNGAMSGQNLPLKKTAPP